MVSTDYLIQLAAATLLTALVLIIIGIFWLFLWRFVLLKFSIVRELFGITDPDKKRDSSETTHRRRLKARRE